MTSEQMISDCATMACRLIGNSTDFEMALLHEWVCELGDRGRVDFSKAPLNVQDKLYKMLLIGAAFTLAIEEKSNER
jgi:hypothetical protein